MSNYKCNVCGAVRPQTPESARGVASSITSHIVRAHPERKPVSDFYEVTEEAVDPETLAKIEADKAAYADWAARKASGVLEKKPRKKYTRKASAIAPTVVLGGKQGFVDLTLPVRIYFSIGSVG
jgi:hypothetical protein